MTVEDEIEDHIGQVAFWLHWMAYQLNERGEVHDRSKLEPPEIEMFMEFTPKLRVLTFGSDEYKAALRDMRPALQHHYENNSHHPEHYPNGIDGMDIIDLMEMFADWITASNQRHTKVNLDHLQERFNICPQLVNIMRNTLEKLEGTQ